MREIAEMRADIDAIDAELLRLLVRRMDVSGEVGEYKQQRSLPVFDGIRERQVIADRVRRAGKYEKYIERLFFAIMDQSKELQRGRAARPAPLPPVGRAAYQGVAGAYSEEAARAAFGTAGLAPQRNFEGVFLAVSRGEADAGIVPVENSATGSVTENYDLLGKYDLFITGEFCLPIDHVLLGLGTMEDVQEVYSHEQGLLQCSAFLAQHPQWQAHTYYNTAMSAKMVAGAGDCTKAAIASRFAGERYGLRILAEHIADSRDNHTRFFSIGREPFAGEAGKDRMLFSLDHSQGSLAAALGALAEEGFNLTKIESRPMPEKNWEYKFYVDLEGDMQRLGAALGRLEAFTSEARVLGTYRKAEAL